MTLAEERKFARKLNDFGYAKHKKRGDIHIVLKVSHGDNGSSLYSNVLPFIWRVHDFTVPTEKEILMEGLK